MAEESTTGIQRADAGAEREFWQRLADIKVAMLTTHDVDGTLTARPVQPVKVESGHVWLFTAMDGGISGDVRRDPEVHLSFINDDQDLFVSLSGEASVLHDPVRARDLWSPTAGAWFTGGPEDPNLALVRIDVHRGDYWDVKDSRLVRFFKMAKAIAENERPPETGVHRRFEN